MSEWIDTKIGLQTTYVSRGVSPKYTESRDLGICVINQKCIRNGRLDLSLSRLHDRDKSVNNDKYLQKGDILINSTGVGTAGRVAIFDKSIKALVDSHVTIVRPDKSLIYPEYLFHSLRYRESEIENYAEGSTGQIELAREKVKDIDVSKPVSIEEQKSIALVLSSLDDKIDLLHRQNTTLEAMAETLFRQWFVEEAQEDWEVGTLGDVIDIFDNQRIPLSKMERDKKKNGVLYPYYGAAQIMDYINDYIFDGEYILMGEDGTVRTDEGYPILQYAIGKFWVNNHTHVLKAKAPYSNFLIWNYLSKKNIDEIVTGAVQPKINQGNLKALDFPKLPESLVLAFNKQTEPMLTKINNNKKQIQTLEKLRDNLLPKLMSGEIRIQNG